MRPSRPRKLVRQGLDAHGAAPELLHVLPLGGERLLGLALDAPLRHRELGAQMVLLGGELADRERELRLHPPPGEALGAGVDGGDDQEGDEGGGEEPDRRDHDGFDHAALNLRGVRGMASPCHGDLPLSSLSGQNGFQVASGVNLR